MIAGGTKPDTAAEVPGWESATEPSRLGAFSFRVWGWVRSESLLLTVLIGSFLTRLFIADRQSYWLDELYSVTIHGGWNESVQELVRVLANITVYPPLYFVILFEWMNWFGDSELATRLLSIIYITLAGLFLYLLLRIGFSKRIALASVITFNLMYTPLYYSLETRPYAQTMFLVTVSSYLLLRILRRGMHEGWRRALVSPTGSIFVVANSALLLTHYYNAFFWVAQGLVACIFVLCEMRPRTWLKGIGSVAVLYGMQAAIFVGVWGRNLLREFGERSGPFTITGAGELPNPFSTVLDRVVSPNIRMPGIVGWVALVLVVVVGVGAFSAIARRTTSSPERIEAWTTIYVLGWMVLPVVVLYLGFLVTGVALYSDRYFVASVVPLAPLLVLGVEKAARSIANLTGRIRGAASDRHFSQKAWAVPACHSGYWVIGPSARICRSYRAKGRLAGGRT